MSKLKEDTRKSIAEFTMLDDVFMTKIFEDDLECTQFLLRIILNDDKIKVIKADTQKKIKNLQGRDLQLDILAEKANGEKFNVEVQNQNSGAVPQRARYHLSVLDANSLPKGKKFNELPENYVIFITKDDVLQGDLPIYHIHRTIDENGKGFVDGSHIIYVNNKIKDNTPLGKLMHDFSCKNPDDMYYEKLAEKARYFKENEKGSEIMGDVLEKLMAKREREAAERAAKRAAKKAEHKKSIEFAENLLAEGMSIDFIVRNAQLSVEEVRKLAEKRTA